MMMTRSAFQSVSCTTVRFLAIALMKFRRTPPHPCSVIAMRVHDREVMPSYFSESFIGYSYI